VSIIAEIDISRSHDIIARLYDRGEGGRKRERTKDRKREREEREGKSENDRRTKEVLGNFPRVGVLTVEKKTLKGA